MRRAGEMFTLPKVRALYVADPALVPWHHMVPQHRSMWM